MNQKLVRDLVVKFRIALERTYEAGEFEHDISFRSFPRGCCGDTSELLAEYLRVKGVNTVYVCGDNRGQTHAWLVIKDNRVKEPRKQYIELPENIIKIYNNYSADSYKNPMDITCYEEMDLINGLIIDITGDQFGEKPIFFDFMDNFHRRFEFVRAYDFERLTDGRLCDLYRKIMKNM